MTLFVFVCVCVCLLSMFCSKNPGVGPRREEEECDADGCDQPDAKRADN